MGHNPRLARFRNELRLPVGRQIMAIRRRWRVSQAEFAELLMSTTRSVRRWETGSSSPGIREQWILSLLEQYRLRHGSAHFLDRFVEGTDRFGKRGRPLARSAQVL